MNVSDLVFRVALITESLAAHPGWERDLYSEQFTSEHLDAGRNHLVSTMTLLEKVGERADDPTAIERARRAVTELDEWYEITARMWRRAAGGAVSEEVWAEMLGRELNGPDELFVVLMRAWRFISMSRVQTAVVDAVTAGGRRVADDMQRGFVITLKAAKALAQHYHVNQGERRNGVAASDVQVAGDRIDGWLRDFASAATLAWIGMPKRLGLLGVVPEGVGRPLGGTAYDVVVHERARGAVPAPTPAGDCPGWGVGTMNNRENYWQHET